MPRKKTLQFNQVLPGAGDMPPDLRGEVFAQPVEFQPAEFPTQPEPALVIEGPDMGLVALVATLQDRVEKMEKALEMWAKAERDGRRNLSVVEAAAVPLHATDAEREAYTRTNFALFQDGLPQHDGIAAWRAAGSPILEPREEKRVEKKRA